MTQAQLALAPVRRRASLAATVFSADARWIRPAHALLLFGLLEFTFIGVSLSDASVDQRVAGNAMNQLASLSLLGLAALLIAARRDAARHCLRANWNFVLVLAIAVISVAWSDYPDLTVRRALLFVCVSAACMGVAVSIDDLRQFHTRLCAAMTLVVVLNLVFTALWPAQGVSIIGVKGIYPQKNEAGMVAMLAAIVATTWTIGCRTATGRLVGFGGIGLAGLFLIVTQSKTSVGLLFTTLGVGFLFQLARRFGPRFVLLIFAGCGALIAALAALFIMEDFDFSKILTDFVSDPTFTGRDELWIFSYKSALKRLWLGYGYGAFWDVGAVNDPLAKLEPGTWLGDIDIGAINEAHNGYLELWLHIGLLATFCAVAAVITGVGAATSRAMRSRDSHARALFAMMAMTLFVYLLHNFTEATLFMRNNPLSNFASLCILMSSLGPAAHAEAAKPARKK